MGDLHAGRIWLCASAVIIVLLGVGGWFLLIGPKYSEASEVRAQVDDTQTQLITLRKKTTELEKQRAQLPKFKDALKANQQALPSSAGVSDFLRQLQDAGDAVSVAVTGVSVASPLKSTVVADVWEVPMTLNAEGNADKL